LTLLSIAVDTFHNNCDARRVFKVKKPLIEKKRRERINKCLRELKRLVLNATDADVSRVYPIYFVKMTK